ncbi:MAG: hypothetical protein LBC65_00555 [Oscillospiraceae bacterium]|jgi:serine/threonine-protein kinase|nr:hypothetical protein [Oscillospiraceae bacterium]
MHDIPQYATFTRIEPLNKGWSSDKKYRVETSDGQRLLLRVAHVTEHDRKRAEFDMLKRVAELDIRFIRESAYGSQLGTRLLRAGDRFWLDRTYHV